MMKSPSTRNLLFILVVGLLVVDHTMSSPTLDNNNNNKEQQWSNHWIMKMSVNDLKTAQKIAREHIFKVVRRVGSLDGYFIIISNDEHCFRSSPFSSQDDFSSMLVSNILAHPLVESVEKEPILVRKKRDFIELPIKSSISQDMLNLDLYNLM